MSDSSHVPAWVNKTITSLYALFGRRILKVLLKRNGGDLEVAESVLQDAFVAAFSSFHTFRHKSSYFTWLTKIALNKLADYYRAQVNSRSRFIVPAIDQFNRIVDPSLSPEERLALDELRVDMTKSLDLLPRQYRQLLQLRYYQELSTREICLKLDLSPRQLEGKLYRAKRKLAAVISLRRRI